MFSKNDVSVLRALAKQLKKAADRDDSQQKIEFWKRHISLKGGAPCGICVSGLFLQ